MRVLILGAGEHGRVVAECAKTAGLHPLGFLDEDAAKHASLVLGIPVLGATSVVDQYIGSGHGLLLGIGRNPTRLSLQRRFSGRLPLPAVYHATAWVSPSATCGEGTVVMANATVQTNCRIGMAVIVNTNASVDHDGVIADGVHIAPGVHLAGRVQIGEGSHIGIGATVIEGIRIGAGCLIAAGAVVVRDVPDGQRVAGVPARVMKPKEA